MLSYRTSRHAAVVTIKMNKDGEKVTKVTSSYFDILEENKMD